MKRNQHLRIFAIIATTLVLLSALTGCRNGKKFDSAEAMIAEMTGIYSGANALSGERIVIDGKNIVRFNIDEIFCKMKSEDFFWDRFPGEDWYTFDIDALLEKKHVEITTKPISVNIKKSTIDKFWIDKDGVLYTEGDIPFHKISSDSDYPTSEMQEKFEEYRKYLQEYEKSIIIAEAENNLTKNKKSLDSALSSAESSDSASYKCTASVETIAQCALESLYDHLKYPHSAELKSFSKEPMYDSYGRVATYIVFSSQNIYGNYITKGYYVVLQSCSNSGAYSFKKGGIHYTDNEDTFQYLLVANSWNTDPSTDKKKEEPYNEAIQLIKKGEYLLAAGKLGRLGDYKSAEKLQDACVSYSAAEKYKEAVDLFAEGEYAEAKTKLAAILKSNDGEYLKAERLAALCTAAINNASNNSGSEQPPATEPPATQPPATQPPATEPPATQPPATQPPATQPPATEPPATQPPVTQPPATEPPATQPPATQPPATQPPATQPPATEPSATEPPVCAHIFTEATCTTPQTCKKCGETTGSAAGHTWKEATCTAPKICTVCGKADGSAAGHTWKDASCTAPKTCSVCGEIDGSAAGHTWKDASCTAPKACTVCGEIRGSALGHSWNNITETVHHEEQGHYEDVQDAKKVQKYRCPRCGYNRPTYATKDEYYAHFDSAHGTELNSSFDRERYEMVEDWVYETVTVWVVDQEAYTETVVIGRRCSVCGTEES